MILLSILIYEVRSNFSLSGATSVGALCLTFKLCTIIWLLQNKGGSTLPSATYVGSSQPTVNVVNDEVNYVIDALCSTLSSATNVLV